MGLPGVHLQTIRTKTYQFPNWRSDSIRDPPEKESYSEIDFIDPPMLYRISPYPTSRRMPLLTPFEMRLGRIGKVFYIKNCVPDSIKTVSRNPKAIHRTVELVSQV
jgi:hypothetical protein